MASHWPPTDLPWPPAALSRRAAGRESVRLVQPDVRKVGASATAIALLEQLPSKQVLLSALCSSLYQRGFKAEIAAAGGPKRFFQVGGDLLTISPLSPPFELPMDLPLLSPCSLPAPPPDRNRWPSHHPSSAGVHRLRLRV